jgi:hypothetical protein
MREIAEIELAIQGGTEKIEQLGASCIFFFTLWSLFFALTWRGMICIGEQGNVDESMREMAAIEALKSEKADKEVILPGFSYLVRRTQRLIVLSFTA